MKIEYVSKRFTASSMAIIEQADTIWQWDGTRRPT